MWLASEECKHTLQWKTPDACPVQQHVSHVCTVREPVYSLHNDVEDNVIKHDNKTFYFNMCGDTHQPCPDQAICFSDAMNLTYDSDLRMQLTSDSKCRNDDNKNVTVDIIFICHHDIPVGKPVLLHQDDWCHYIWKWETRLACPPHDVTQCSIQGPDGEVDLSSLSLPSENYQIRDNTNNGMIILNVCRSIVHSKTHCPYHAAACFVKTSRGQVVQENLGQVVPGQSGLRIDPSDGQVYLEYKLGSICSDSASNRTHIETKLYFECAHEVTESEPELVDSSDCKYLLRWCLAAACPVTPTRHGGCSVTNPNTSFTYDLKQPPEARLQLQMVRSISSYSWFLRVQRLWTSCQQQVWVRGWHLYCQWNQVWDCQQ